MKLSVLWFDASALPRRLDDRILAFLFFGSAAAWSALSLDFSFPALAWRFAVASIGFALALGIVLFMLRALHSPASLQSFLPPVLFSAFVALAFGLFLRLAASALDGVLGGLVESVAPFYTFAVLGWTVEHASLLKSNKAFLAGTVAAVLVAAAAWLSLYVPSLLV